MKENIKSHENEVTGRLKTFQWVVMIKNYFQELHIGDDK